MGGGTLPKLSESVILTIGPKVFAATLELKTQGMKLPLLSSANTALLALPCVLLTWLRRWDVPRGGVHFPANLFPPRGLIATKNRCTFRKLTTCSCSTSPTELPTTPSVRKSS